MLNTIPPVMRAVLLTGHGGLEQLEFRNDWPTPTPQDTEVLIEVRACGLNNTDVNLRTAWYSKGVTRATTGTAYESANAADASWGGSALQFPRIQGADVCGTVVAIGRCVPDHLLGKRVMIEPWIRDWCAPDNMDRCGFLGSECDGGYAEYLVVDHQQVHPVTSKLSDVEIATFATSWLTAENMLDQAQVTADDTVLITGASGGVGSALIQLANRRKATTIAMASESKHARLKAFAPDALISRAEGNLPAQLIDAIGRNSVTVVADVVGGENWGELISVLTRKGRYVCSGAIAGPMVELDLRTLYLNDLTFLGCTVVPPGTFANLVRYIDQGELMPVVAAIYPLEKFKQAQQELIDKRHVGNLVIQVKN